MVPLSKYQDNPAPASAKAGASPSRSLGRNWGRIEEYLERRTIRKENEKINLFLSNRGPEMGSTCIFHLKLTHHFAQADPPFREADPLDVRFCA